jgi:DNA polymerase III alpha subunit (gram-positive type)
MVNATVTYFMVDVECDGPVPGDFSMISLGAVLVDTRLETTFYGELRPISDRYQEPALKVSGLTREQALGFNDPSEVMRDFKDWVEENTIGRPVFISDNTGFDWMFVCWYFHHFLGENPFGYNSVNLASLFHGLTKEMGSGFRHLCKTPHSHHPVDDALGNAEALLAMIDLYNLE